MLGATHTAELPYVFGNVGDLPLPSGTCNLGPSEKAISTFLMSAWSSMATSAQPNPKGVDAPWPAYDPVKTLGININASVVPGMVDYSVCTFWDLVYAGLNNASLIPKGGNDSASSGLGNVSARGTSGSMGPGPTNTAGMSTFKGGVEALGRSILTVFGVGVAAVVFVLV